MSSRRLSLTLDPQQRRRSSRLLPDDVELNQSIRHLPRNQSFANRRPTITQNNNNNNGDTLNSSRHSTSSSKSTSSKTKTPSLPPASFSALFQFATTRDKVQFGLGCVFAVLASATMPAINIVFGDIIDSIAAPINVQELVNT